MIHIQPMRSEYIERFHQTLDAVARESGHLARSEAPSLESTRDFVRSILQNDQAQFIALAQDRLVGWCDAVPQADQPHVCKLGMGVLQAYRQRGIGLHLIYATLEKAFATGAREIRLTVHQTNRPAIALYEKAGFQMSRVDCDPVHGKAVYHMSLTR